MTKKKICMLGTLAVGKTSLVRRFVSNQFDDNYLSTIGVKIEQKTVNDLTLVLWDLHGDDEFQRLQTSYLKGTSGYFLVADGTRKESVQALESIQEKVMEVLGDVPFVVLINKCDLAGQWSLEPFKKSALNSVERDYFATSAKNGEGVEEAFSKLASLLSE